MDWFICLDYFNDGLFQEIPARLRSSRGTCALSLSKEPQPRGAAGCFAWLSQATLETLVKSGVYRRPLRKVGSTDRIVDWLLPNFPIEESEWCRASVGILLG